MKISVNLIAAQPNTKAFGAVRALILGAWFSKVVVS